MTLDRSVLRQRGSWVFGAALTAFAQMILSQEAPEPVSPPDERPIRGQDFQPVLVKHRYVPGYPDSARTMGDEGWVNLRLMVSAAGKPYQIYVIGSSGNHELERAALEAMKSWTFEPAKIGGQPIESAVTQKMNFELNGGIQGARPEFVATYRRLNGALDNKDRLAADEQFKHLHITTIYEDAYYGFAQYRYAALWGTTDQQIVALRRSVADEVNPHLLPPGAFASALRALLPLEINTKDFASSVETWERLKNVETDKKVLAALSLTMEKVQALRTDQSAYKVSGHIDESSWCYRLFKRKFQISVSSGQLSEVRLWCDRKFVTFSFDPELQYKVSDHYGECSMMLVGQPGTTFDLVQL